ncbi:EpsD family peptidyl-prolyl cis-trans isomerase [Noviherbaspirillum sedimenti]|uniref:EpsD family peptidyl-prolyl cis-trans isomerase n=1 Tax=Noviherbaspirillum sedimenti TaxID=2320865 RepID=UPI001F3BE50D|nr:EpsD family peptidyl-prolyl cis-trans isomerase [Noviherbaspirillum sedimenti]
MVFSSALGACGKFDLPGAAVARVNGKAITEYQFGNELLRTSTGPTDAGRTQVLQKLIDRQLLQAEAQRHSIDRDPHVMSAIESAKAQILAEAYLQSRLAYVPAPSRDEIAAYFHRHPEQFAKRTLFHLKEMALPSTQLTGELQSVLDQARTLEDIAAWLDGRRVLYTQARQTRSSADMPAALLARMQDMQAGQMAVVREGDSASLFAIMAIEPSPVTLATATPQIERILQSQKARELGQAELSRLRLSARVEYANGAGAPLARMQGSATLADTEKFVSQSGVQQHAAQ